MSEPEDWGFPEQKQALERVLRSRGGIVWWKPGAGKTRIGIKWFDEMRKIYKNEFPCVAMVALKRTAFLDFRKELVKLDYDCVVLEDNLDDIPEATKIAMLQKPTLLLVSAAMLPRSVGHLLVDPRVKYGILDELHLYKNPTAQRSKAAQKFSLQRKTIGLSGSVMTKSNIEDPYGQLMAVQKHRYVASNMTQFRDKFLHMKMKELKSGKLYPWKFPKSGAFRQIMELCKDCVHVYDPPKKNRKVDIQILTVPSTPEQDRAFFDLKKWMEVNIEGNIIEYKNKLEVAIRIQQIANGWLLDQDQVTRRIKSNKPEVLADKLAEIVAAGERAIVWCAFRRDVHELQCYLTGKQIATVQFMSGEPFDHARWEAKEAQICVATEAMGVSVNHFEQVPYAFYFSQNYKWLDLQQSMARTDRYSSLHPTAFYYFLQVEGSLDAAIYQSVNNAKDWENRLIDIGEALTRWQKA